MKKSFSHRLLITLAITGMFFQTLYPLLPIYKVYAEDTVVVEENSSSSSSEKQSETSSSSSESSQISSESSSSSTETVYETSSSTTQSSLTSSSSSSSSSSEESVVQSSSSKSTESSSSSESVVLVSSSSSSATSSIEESILSESSSSSQESIQAPIISPDTVITSVVPNLNEVVEVTLVESNKPNNVLENIFPFLFTDKSDYAPTESAVITGKGFSPNGIYIVTVSSKDNPETTTTHNVIVSSEGTFTYVYQLDGIYRPNYVIEVKDVSGTVVATSSFTDSDTSYKAPTSSSGSWTNASNAYADGGGFATGNHNNTETYSNFGFSIPSGDIVTGIEVQADTWSSNNDFCQLNVQLSWNGGLNWTSQKTTGNLGNSETTKTLGTSTDNWGRTWNANDFTNSNFRLRVQHGDSGSACGGNDSTYLDFIRAKVTYISNVAPVISEGTSTNVDMSVNGAPTAFALTLHATDADMPTQILTWNISSNGSHGSASVSGSGNSKSITYVPDDNYVGTDSFIVRVSDPYGLTDTIMVNVNISVVTNPLFTSTCGNDISLVIDTSFSTNINELNQSKTALIGIVNALSTTPNRFSVVKFGTSATVVQSFTSNTTDVINAINSVNLSFGLTNLSAGISTARGTFDPRTDKPNLMIVATDGNPTWPLFSGLTSAINQSSLTKSYPIRMVMLGIGSGVNVNNLKVISGPIVGSDSNSDVITSNFNGLATSLASAVSQTCGSIKIVKDSLPDDPQDFTFTTTGGLTPNTLTLDDDPNDQTYSNSYTYMNLVAGNYSISENEVEGWNQTSANCSNENSASSIVLAAGENITCTFTNTKKGHIIVDKVTLPSDDPQSFNFLLRGVDPLKSFSLSDQSTPEDTELNPGTYAVKESNSSEILDKWNVSNINCGEGINSLNIVLEPGQTITCTFTNTKKATLIVQKTTNPSNDPTLFQINLVNQNDQIIPDGIALDTISDNTDKTYTVIPGKYTVNEIVPEGWVQTGNECKDLVLSPGETKTCEITNTKLSSIKIVKNATVNALDDFSFTDSLNKPFTLDDDEGVVGADDVYSNSKIFSELLPGGYIFTEVNLQNLWSLRDVVCVDSENNKYFNVMNLQNGINVNLAAGVDLTCTFNNVKGSVLGEQTGQVLAVTGDTSYTVQVLGLLLILGSFGVLVIRKTRKKYSK